MEANNKRLGRFIVLLSIAVFVAVFFIPIHDFYSEIFVAMISVLLFFGSVGLLYFFFGKSTSLKAFKVLCIALAFIITIAAHLFAYWLKANSDI